MLCGYLYLTHIGSDPHDVSLSVQAAVMEGKEAPEWAALHHEGEYSSASRGDRSVFMLAGWKQIVNSAVASVLNCRAEFGNISHTLTGFATSYLPSCTTKCHGKPGVDNPACLTAHLVFRVTAHVFK